MNQGKLANSPSIETAPTNRQDRGSGGETRSLALAVSFVLWNLFSYYMDSRKRMRHSLDDNVLPKNDTRLITCSELGKHRRSFRGVFSIKHLFDPPIPLSILRYPLSSFLPLKHVAVERLDVYLYTKLA